MGGPWVPVRDSDQLVVRVSLLQFKRMRAFGRDPDWILDWAVVNYERRTGHTGTLPQAQAIRGRALFLRT